MRRIAKHVLILVTTGAAGAAGILYALWYGAHIPSDLGFWRWWLRVEVTIWIGCFALASIALAYFSAAILAETIAAPIQPLFNPMED